MPRERSRWSYLRDEEGPSHWHVGGRKVDGRSALSELGYEAVDTDFGGFSVVDERGSHWDVDRIRELLATEDVDVLFLVGSDDTQVMFYPDFDYIILLSAPRPVMIERLSSRTNNRFGKSPDELAKVLADLEK